MKRKMNVLLATLALSTLIVGSCGKKEAKPTKSSESTSISTKESTETKKTSEQKSTKGAVDFSKVVAAMKEEMDAESANALYDSTDPINVDQGKVSVQLDGYELVEVKDFHKDFAIPFGDQTDSGGVLLTQFTIKNNDDKVLYFSPIMDFTFTGATKAYSNTKSLLPDDFDFLTSLFVKAKNELKAGEEKTGYLPVALDPKAMEAIQKEGFITMTVPRAYSKPDSSKTEDAIGEDQTIQLPITETGSKTVADNADFYQDKVSIDNMGTKKMIVDKEKINKSETLDKIDVTLNGYQFVDFEPNADTAARFKNFKNGMVLLTVNFTLKNNGDKNIGLSSSSSVLSVNDGDQKVLNEGMLLPYKSEEIKNGEERDFLQTYVLDKEQYDKIWKDKSFSTELKLRDENAKEVGKGDAISFDLPK